MKQILETIFETSKIQMKQSFSRATYRFCLLIQPIIYTIITYMMYKNSGLNNFVAFVVLGTGLLTLWSCICFSSAGDIERERYMGTLEVIYCSPTNFKLIMLGKILGNTILGLVPLLISLIIVKFFFNGNIFIKEPLIFTISFLLTIVSFIGISMLFASLFTLSRSSRILMNCIEYPFFILCGVLFPIEILPQWTVPFSYILSPTWAVKILKMGVNGIDNISTFYTYSIILILLTMIYFILANVLFNVIDKKTRINATLGVS